MENARSKGLVQVQLKKVVVPEGKTLEWSKLYLKIGEQGYPINFDLTNKKQLAFQQCIKMFSCAKEDSFQMDYTDSKNGESGFLRFPLRKITEMPRVNHIIEAIMISKPDKDKGKNKQQAIKLQPLDLQAKKKEQESEPKKQVQKKNGKQEKQVIKQLMQIHLQLIYLNALQGKLRLQSVEVQKTQDKETEKYDDSSFVVMHHEDDHFKRQMKRNQGKTYKVDQIMELSVRQAGESKLVLQVSGINSNQKCVCQVLLLKEGLLIPTKNAQQRQFNLMVQNKNVGTVKIKYQFEIETFNY